MRIAQVAPLLESVPPKMYGGTERIVSYLTEELVGRGHEVTLYASGDAETHARLVAPCDRALRLDEERDAPEVYNILMLDRLFQEADRYDVIHFHLDFIHYPFLRGRAVPHVTTLHNRLDLNDLVPLYRAFPDVPVVSISDAQRAPLPWLNWQQTVYHGLPRDRYRLHQEPEDYLAFVGRVAPEKGLDRAIEIARKAALPLKIAAKVGATDRSYFEEQIEPLLEDPNIYFIGEVGEKEKEALLGHARALLFPIDWPEPFGLVMTEALACGTPVVAYRRGSVPEIVRDGISGFVVDGIEEAVDAVERAAAVDRAQCRQYFEERFSVAGMTDHYLDIYQNIHNAPASSDAP